jgi:hypothetical protein
LYNRHFFNEKKIFFSLITLLLLFTSSFSSSTIDNALEKKLYKSYIWKSLLHIRDGKSNINNSTFLLSYENFSLKNELIKTIDAFEKGLNICKFPARYEWLKNQLPNNKFKDFNCEEFSEYLQKIDPQDLELVFASENVSSPSSMMGHVFFNIKSKRKNKKIKQNAVSFFTVIDTYNIPLLITKSTITGMKGYFVLNPYRNSKNKYLYDEQRSIWEYKLNLSENEKKLIIYHFWELKDIDMTYYFTGFNCATMIDNILSITGENYIDENSLWVTPKDVIKNAEKNKLILNTKMIPSIEWELKMLREEIENKKIDQILEVFENKNFDIFENVNFFSSFAKSSKLERQFILTYGKYLFNKNIITKDQFLGLVNILKDEEYVISLENYKNPIETFDDSQISLSYMSLDKKKYTGLTFLPASNSIYDDNREYFSENSLKIGEIDLLFNKEKHDMKLLIPRDKITNDISKQFNVSYEKHYDNKLNKLNVLNVSGGAGLTLKIHNDVWIYGLTNIGLGLNLKKTYPYLYSDIGFIMYELFDMKTVLSHKLIYNQNNSNDYYEKFSINQSLFMNKKMRFDIAYDKLYNEEFDKKRFAIKINYFF